MRELVSEPHLRYIENVFCHESPVQKKIRECMVADGVSGMSVSPSEGQIIFILLKALRVRSVVEFGTLYGYSASWIIRSLPQDGLLIGLEKNTEHAKKASHFLTQLNAPPRVTILHGDAEDSLSLISDQGPFDAAFIDADKAAYPKYLTWCESHIRNGGLIIGDNTFLFGGVYDQNTTESPKRVSAMKSFNERLADPTRYDSALIPTTEGLTVAIKRF